MLLDQNPELQLRATRPKPLMISIMVHALLILVLAFTPNWFETTPRRVIRIAGEDFDLSRLELTPLTLPPRTRAPAAPAPQPAPPSPQEPLVQPPQATPPPPPPHHHHPPPPPPPPDRVIRPDDVLADGARPDGSPRASRGDTRDQARAGGPAEQQAQQAQEAQKAQEGQKAQRGQEARQGDKGENRVLPNTNPNALRTPSLYSALDQIVEANIDEARRNQSVGRTGIARGDNNGTFSTEPQILSPNPKGIDFGPYMNQLLNRLRANWYSVMPEMARLGQRGRVDIVFTITKTGIVKDLHVVVNSGFEALDKGALSAIQLSNPFQQLPAEYETDLRLRIAFLYNMYP